MSNRPTTQTTAGPLDSYRPWRSLRWAHLFRFSPVKLLIALVLYICSAPVVDELHHGPIISSLLMTAVLITATLTMGSRRWTLLVAVVLVIPALAARWAFHIRPDLVPTEVFSVAGILFVGFVTANILYFILHVPEVGSDVLCAGISGYLLLGVLWAFAYTLVFKLSPDAFEFTARTSSAHEMQGFTADYFSYITLCSVGYGDIVPVSPVARMLAMVEAMTGTFYVAVMIARLVALHSSRKHRE
jgi:hypothetical protein